jgi:bifunctional oligoribonuclease and PAP phosphatase NrnA
MTNVPDTLLGALRGAQRLVLSGHANPDGDSVGSALGLARVLRRLGKGAVIWNRDRTPHIYSRLPGVDAIHTGESPPAGFPEAFDAVVSLECPSLDRTGLESALGALPVFNIDHHLGNTHYGAQNWVDTSAPSLGEMIHRLARRLNVALDPETATCLYLTLVTDTGGFRFANASAEAFAAAAELVREGAAPTQVSQWIYESRPASAIRLLGELLATLRLDAGGRIASVVLESAMFERAAASAADTEGLIDVPRSIDGVEAVALVRQLSEGEQKVSLRSRGDLDVQKLALRHGGGGHRNAAGYAMRGAPDEVREAVVTELTAALG